MYVQRRPSGICYMKVHLFEDITHCTAETANSRLPCDDVRNRNPGTNGKRCSFGFFCTSRSAKTLSSTSTRLHRSPPATLKSPEASKGDLLQGAGRCCTSLLVPALVSPVQPSPQHRLHLLHL